MNRYQYGYRNGRYRGYTGADSASLFSWALSMVLGVGLSGGLTLLCFVWPTKWAMAALTGTLVVGGVMCLVCRRFDWPFAMFFDIFAVTTLVFWIWILRFRVTLLVVLWNGGHLKVVSAIVGGLAAVVFFLWEKRRLDEPPVPAAVFLAVMMGLFSFALCHSALLGMDILADGGETRQATAQVIRVEDEYHATVGRVSHSYTLYFVVVGENDLTSGGRYPVNKAAYDSLEPGDQVRLILHPGALGAPWLECEPAED